METIEYLPAQDGHSLAYKKSTGTGPVIIWCGGLKSDMDGSKAVHLHTWAKQQGRAFIRFDYFGHGESSGEFTNGTISQWAADVTTIIKALCASENVILIGSSMGGWASLLAAMDNPSRIAGMVLINPAPDFTEKLTVANWTQAQIKALEDDGIVYEPSGYDEPYAYSKALIEDGRARQILDAPIHMSCPIHILSGSEDPVVPTAYAARLLDALHVKDGQGDVHFTKITGADHSLSRPEDLVQIEAALSDILDHTK